MIEDEFGPDSLSALIKMKWQVVVCFFLSSRKNQWHFYGLRMSISFFFLTLATWGMHCFTNPIHCYTSTVWFYTFNGWLMILFSILQNYLDEQEMRRVTWDRIEHSQRLIIISVNGVRVLFAFSSLSRFTSDTHTYTLDLRKKVSSPLKNRIDVIRWKVITDRIIIVFSRDGMFQEDFP